MDAKTKKLRQLAADIHKDIGRAEPIGDAQLARQIQRAQALLRWLNEERDQRKARRAVHGKGVLDKARQERQLASPQDTSNLPKRDAIVLCLEQIGVPSSPARIAALARHSLNLTISTSQFASFRKADERSYHRKRRNRVYIVPALSAEDLSGLAGAVTLSSWPMERRVIGGYSHRVDALKALIAAFARHRETGDRSSSVIVEIISRELPLIGRHGPSLEKIAKAAAADLKVLEPQDQDERRRAAARSEKLDPATRLFGKAPLTVVGGE